MNSIIIPAQWAELPMYSGSLLDSLAGRRNRVLIM